jgi:hypothetical protein
VQYLRVIRGQIFPFLPLFSRSGLITAIIESDRVARELIGFTESTADGGGGHPMEVSHFSRFSRTLRGLRRFRFEGL